MAPFSSLWAVMALFATLQRLVIGLSLPNVLFSQSADASPAILLDDFDISSPFSNPEGNQLGAVASESSICSNIGIDILKQGGNAADVSWPCSCLCITPYDLRLMSRHRVWLELFFVRELLGCTIGGIENHSAYPKCCANCDQRHWWWWVYACSNE